MATPQGLGLNILDMNTFTDQSISPNSSDSSIRCSDSYNQSTSASTTMSNNLRKKSVSWANTPDNGHGGSTSSLCRMISITQIDQKARLSRRENYRRGGGGDADDELGPELDAESLDVDEEDEYDYEVDVDSGWGNSGLASELGLGRMSHSHGENDHQNHDDDDDFQLQLRSHGTGTFTTSILSSNSSCGTGSSSGTSSGNEDDEREEESSRSRGRARGRTTHPNISGNPYRSHGIRRVQPLRQQPKIDTLPGHVRKPGSKFDEDMLPAKPIKGYFAARVKRVDSFDGRVDELDQVDVEEECEEVWRSWVGEM